jgi:mannose-6-phosphate isomerase-like protein (cupin superfamily)
MVLAPGQKEGDSGNRHRGADQWLFVISGSGRATISGRQCRLRSGSLLLIERGETHEIENTGRTPLRTVNTYVPPAYDTRGRALPRGK